MKKIREILKDFKSALKESNKSTIIVYFVLRALVILCLVLQIIHGDMNNAFLCLLSLILFTIPFFIQKHLKIELPNTLEILILLFIFAAEILGEINNFFGTIPFWDSLLHTINGFLAAGVGFALFDLLNKNTKHVKLSPLFLSIVAFCFSMTIGVLWEFFEFAADRYLNLDMQKDRIVTNINSVLLNEKKENVPIHIDKIEYTIVFGTDENNNKQEIIINDGYLDIGIIDTTKDLFVNFIGATCFSIFGYLYIKNRNRYKFINKFMPSKQKSKESL